MASIASKHTVKNQSQASELGQGALAGSGFVLLFNRQIALGPLDWRIVSDVAAFAYAGLSLTIAGLGFVAWSRVALGRSWSATVTIKQDRDLVSWGSGPRSSSHRFAGLLLFA